MFPDSYPKILSLCFLQLAYSLVTHKYDIQREQKIIQLTLKVTWWRVKKASSIIHNVFLLNGARSIQKNRIALMLRVIRVLWP